jgi:hypothetical protein
MLYIETPRPNTNRHVHAHTVRESNPRSRRVFPPLRQIGRYEKQAHFTINVLKYDVYHALRTRRVSLI